MLLASCAVQYYRRAVKVGTVIFTLRPNSSSSTHCVHFVSDKRIKTKSENYSKFDCEDSGCFVDSNALVSVVVHFSTMDAPPPERTLMSKWKEHYDTKIFPPSPEVANRYAVSAFWIILITLILSLHFTLVPSVFEDRPTHRIVFTLISWMFFFQIAANWFLTARIGPSIVREAITPVDSRFLEGWYNCPSCQLYAPPRAHHCKTCGVCVLKRDHHCFFTACCVGFTNQRSFVAMAFHVAAGSVLCICLIIAHLNTWLPSHSGWTYVPLVALWQWLTGSLLSSHAFLLLQLYVSFITLFAGSSFVFWQMVIISRGQTSYEFEKNIHRYRATADDSFRSVFGPFWLLYFICPLLGRPQEGDGIVWKTEKAVKGH